jgi:hypothetical protein
VLRYLFLPFGAFIYLCYIVGLIVFPLGIIYATLGPGVLPAFFLALVAVLILLVASLILERLGIEIDLDNYTPENTGRVVYSDGEPQGVDANKVNIDPPNDKSDKQ